MSNEVALVEFIESNKKTILSRFPKLNDWLTPEIWWSVLRDISKDEKLQEVAKNNPDSLLDALLKLADWGLKPDKEEAFISVYKGTATAQWMFKGGIRRAVESGAIAHAVADLIREGDKVKTYTDRHGRHLEVEEGNRKPNSKIVGAYCLFWLPNGLMDYEKLDIQDIEKAKAASVKVVGKVSQAWEYGYGEMAKKTAVRRGLKRMQGKRDSSYSSMMATTTPFDAETTAENVGELSPEETPRARVSDVEATRRAINDHLDDVVDERRQDAVVEEGAPLETSGEAPVADGDDYPTADDVMDVYRMHPSAKAAMDIIRSVIPDLTKRGGLANTTGPERKKVMEALRR